MDIKQVIFGVVIAVMAGVAGTSIYYVASPRPSYIVEGQFNFQGPCDGGVCTGQFAGAISTAVPADAGVLDAGSVLDASPLDASPLDASPLDASPLDASPLDASPLDASPLDTGVVADASLPLVDAGSVFPSTWTSTLGISEVASLAVPPPGLHLIVNQLPLPSVGSQVCDPLFGTCERRLLSSGYHDYSQLRPLSDDDQYILLYSPNGNHAVYQFSSMALVYEDIGGQWTAPRWRPGTHNIVYFGDNPASLKSFNVDTKTTSVIFTTSYPTAISGNPWEQPSEDGQWWSMYTQTATGTRVIMAVNVLTGQVGAKHAIDAVYAPSGPCQPDPTYGKIEPDFIAISPNGKYLGVQWVMNSLPQGYTSGMACRGLELYDIQTGAFVRRLHLHHNHGDWGVNSDGRDFYMTSDSAPSVTPNYDGIYIEWLDGSPPNVIRAVSWPMVPAASGTGFAFASCRGPHAGVCIVTGTGEYSGGPLSPQLGEIWAVFVDGRVQRLAHHRSSLLDSTGAFDYLADPSAAFSLSGRYIIFRTNWGNNGQRYPMAIKLY